MMRIFSIVLFLLANINLFAVDDTLLVVQVNELNSQYDDYAPVNVDTNLIIFTSSRPNILAERIMANNHNMFVSQKENGNWTIPKFISYLNNSDNYETSAGISADRNTLFIYKSYYGGDLYYSDINGQVLSSPKKLSINSIYHESSACFFNGILYFVSDRPGGKGGHDIYYSIQNKDNKWSEPINLNVVNSDKDENYVFITDNGNTLYFSSNGNGTKGGYDIFKSVKNGDLQWSLPQNVGDLINTSFDEICFTKDISGRIYFSSNRPDENNKGYNIYTCIENKIRVKVPIELTGASPIVESNVGTVDQVKKFVEVEGYKRDIPNKITIDLNIVKDSTNILKVENLLADKKIKVLDNPADSIIKIKILYKRTENLSLKEIKDKIDFDIKYCKVQVGAFSTMESIIEFNKRFPLLGDKVIMIRNEKYNRFLMRETFESIDSAAVLQQKCLKEYHSVPDTFIAVYDGFGKRVVIYFDLKKNSYIMLKPEQQNTDDMF
ncbi:MAG: PD40 domain-containing protein [Bacteroidia bacterium]|nr:PD40 domain-containing protein [Bacteroidia bacterium]